MTAPREFAHIEEYFPSDTIRAYIGDVFMFEGMPEARKFMQDRLDKINAAHAKSVDEFKEKAAGIADLWVNSPSCRPDKTPCDCMRVSETIADAIRALKIE